MINASQAEKRYSFSSAWSNLEEFSFANEEIQRVTFPDFLKIC